MRQRDVPAKQGKRPSRRRRAEAHSGGGELSREADGVVMDIDVPSGRAIGGRCIEVFTSWLSSNLMQ